jgi:hypothetical protein
MSDLCGVVKNKFNKMGQILTGNSWVKSMKRVLFSYCQWPMSIVILTVRPPRRSVHEGRKEERKKPESTIRDELRV